MNHSRIRGFLLMHPKPALVRIDGEQELKPGKSFSKCAETIAALGGDLLECIDADGKVLRAVRMGSSEAQRSEAAAVPAGLEVDPQALMLTHFANLLHRAYEHSTEIAFAKMVELVERLGDRSEAIERRLERAEGEARRLAQEQISEAWDRAEEAAEKAGADSAGGGDIGQTMLAAFLSGQAQKQAATVAAAAATPANGKATKTTNGKGQA